jgi:hypothetical protein
LNRAIDYGNSYLFAFYLAEHYGVDILRNLVKVQEDGALGIETCLQNAGYNIKFNDLYLNYITTLTIDKIGFRNNLYGFENLDARISNVELVDEFPLLPKSLPLRYYGFHTQKFQFLPDDFTIELIKAPNQSIGTSVVIHDNNGWWVRKFLHDEPDTIITDNFTCDSIVESYVITSYMRNETPTEVIDFGVGPQIEIEISIFETLPSSSSTNDIQKTSNNTPGFQFIIVFTVFLCYFYLLKYFDKEI